MQIEFLTDKSLKRTAIVDTWYHMHVEHKFDKTSEDITMLC